MEAIRSRWEVPCVAHFCHIFKKPFKLPAFEIEELEDALLLDCFPSPSKLLVEIYCRFLDGIIDTEINEDNWPLMLKLHLKWRCDNLKEKWNPLSGETVYKDLDIYSRVSIMHKLCHWRLELDDIGDLLRGLDGPSLRLNPVGRDMDGNTYWHFYGTRLYKEDTKKKKKKKDGPDEATPGKTGARKGKEVALSTGRKKGAQNKGATLSSQRGRSKQVIQENATPTGRRSGRKTKKNHQVTEEEEEEASVDDEVEEGSGSEGKVGEEPDEQEDEDHGSEKKADGEVSNGVVTETGSSLTVSGVPESVAVPESGWMIACTDVDEWNEVIESFKGSKHNETKKLLRTLQEILPEVEYIHSVRQKQLKKRMLEDLPRRTSDRIAIKAAIREEEDRMEAMSREMQREELRNLEAEEVRMKEEEADMKRQKRMEEALQRRKAREEQQEKQRMEEEDNWEKAMSGELKGRRKAAIGAAENVSEVQMAENFLLTDKDFDLYTAMHKILAGLRKHDESWVFEDPVTEAIAPGYFEVVDKPMDYSTVEKKVEDQTYKDKDEFITDIELIYTNCCDYNGDESEYFELAEEIRKLFHTLVGVHFEGKSSTEELPEGKTKKGQRRDSRSPSACKTPELTSESSSEEGSDEESDESYIEGGERRTFKKPKGRGGSMGSMLKLTPSLEQRLGSGFPPRMPHPHHMMGPHGHPPPPHLYHHFMQQYMQHRMQRPPHMPGGPDMYPPGAPYPSPPRLPPPYPGFPPDHHASPPRPPPGGMYRQPPEHQAMYGPPVDMMRPPMYPPGHPYPPPHPSHPAHPAHPHHAAYRQHMHFYEMQYHGMDPRMMGMRPGMRPGMGPGMGPGPGMSPGMGPGPGMSPGMSPGMGPGMGPGIGPGMVPRLPFPGMRHSPHSDGKSDTASVSSEQKQEVKVTGNSEEDVKESVVGNVVEDGDGGEGKDREERGQEAASEEEEEKKLGKKQVKEVEKGNEGRDEKELERKEEQKDGEQAGKVEQEKVETEGKVTQAGEGDVQAHKEEGTTKKEEAEPGAPKSATDAKGSSDRSPMTPEQIEKYRYFQQQQHMIALQHQHRREAVARGYPVPPHPTSHPDEAAAAAAYYGHQYGGFPPPHADPRQMEAAHHYWMQMEARKRQYAMMKQAQQAHIRRQQREGGVKERSAETGQEGLEDVPDYQESLRKYALGLGEQGPDALPHSKKREGELLHSMEREGAVPRSMEREGAVPRSIEREGAVPHSMEREGAVPHSMEQEGAHSNKLGPHKEREGATHHSKEQEPHKEREGATHHSQEPHKEGEGATHHSSEGEPHKEGEGATRHRKEQEPHRGDHSKELEGAIPNRTPPSQGTESRKRKGPSHSNPHVYPGGMPPFPPMPPMLNGYPPYPIPPYHPAAHGHHHFPTEGGDRRNGASGYPPDAYYSSHLPPYRMPPYPTFPNTHKSDELWPKQTPAEVTTERVDTPPAKRPHPVDTPPAAKRPCSSS